MSAHSAPLIYTQEIDLPYKEIIVHPLSDVHIEASGHTGEQFKRRIKRIADAGPEHRVLLLGDLSDIQIVGSKGFKHGAQTPDDAKRLLLDALDSVRDRVDLIIPGNHEARVQRNAGLDFTQQLAVELGIADKYRPAYTALRYRFNVFQKDGSDPRHYKTRCEILAHHGFGGGRTPGPKINRVSDLQKLKADADCYIMGHVHEQAARMGVVVSGWPPKPKRQWFVLSGCWLAGEQYGRDAAFAHAATGAPSIRAYGEGNQNSLAMEVTL